MSDSITYLDLTTDKLKKITQKFKIYFKIKIEKF